MSRPPWRTVLSVSLLSVSYLLHTLSSFLQALSTTVAASALLASASLPLSLASLPYALLFAVAAVVPPLLAAAVLRTGSYRAPFFAACAVGVAGGALAAVAIYADSFAILCVASALLGVPTTAGNFFRFAATTLVQEPQHMARAVSAVLISGVVATLIGAPIADAIRDLIPPYTALPIYIAIAVIYVVMAGTLAGVRYPAKDAGAAGQGKGKEHGEGQGQGQGGDDERDAGKDTREDEVVEPEVERQNDEQGDEEDVDEEDEEGRQPLLAERARPERRRADQPLKDPARNRPSNDYDGEALGAPGSRPTPQPASVATVPVAVILTSPRTLACMAGAAGPYLVMTMLMAIVPLEAGAKFEEGVATNIMSAHAMCMFLPFFFTGLLNERIGERIVLLGGLTVSLVSVLILLFSGEVWAFYVGMCLVGAGWSLSFVAATTALTKLYTPAQRPKTQAVNDVVVFGLVALGTALSAVIFEAIGWAGMVYVCLGIACTGVLVGLVNLR